mmetsp:Transcript_31479/g.80319  ORF Transcript_31479/g.80319 Transcript_31479/m.80319 type:complete len:319 (+) Transcript_31479:626-1582(+)
MRPCRRPSPTTPAQTPTPGLTTSASSHLAQAGWRHPRPGSLTSGTQPLTSSSWRRARAAGLLVHGPPVPCGQRRLSRCQRAPCKRRCCGRPRRPRCGPCLRAGPGLGLWLQQRRQQVARQLPARVQCQLHRSGPAPAAVVQPHHRATLQAVASMCAAHKQPADLAQPPSSRRQPPCRWLHRHGPRLRAQPHPGCARCQQGPPCPLLLPPPWQTQPTGPSRGRCWLPKAQGQLATQLHGLLARGRTCLRAWLPTCRPCRPPSRSTAHPRCSMRRRQRAARPCRRPPSRQPAPCSPASEVTSPSYLIRLWMCARWTCRLA